MPDSRIIFGSPSLQTGRMIFKGQWSSIVSYFVNDVVYNAGNSYIAIADSFNVSPTITTSWSIMASGNAVTSVAGRTGSISLTSADLGDKDAANGVAGLDASGFMKSAEQTVNANSQTGTTYAIVAGDRGKLLTFSNTSPVSVSIAQATGSFAAGWYAELINLNTGLVTVTATTSLIEGSATVTLKQWESVVLTSVGGQYVAMRSKVRVPATAAVSHNFVTAIAADGTGTLAQPAAADLSNGVTGSGAVVLAASPTISGTAALSNAVLNGANTGAGAALTVGGTTSTTGGISIFVGASGSQTERISIIPADGASAAVRVGALSVRTPNAGFLTGAEVASISTAGAIAGVSLALGGGTALTTTNRTGTGNLVLATSPSVSDPTLTGVTLVKRIKATQGTALVTGDVGSISNFGSTATCSAVTGTDGAGTISITSSGTGQIANGSFTLTFHDGTWTTAPVVVACRGDGSGPNGAPVATSASATAVSFIFSGVAVAGTTYIFNFICVGK